MLSALENRAIADGDNGSFFVRLATELAYGHAFDEFHAGYGEDTLLGIVWRAPYRWGAVELALIVLVGIWVFGGRERPAVAEGVLRRRDTRDHVQAVADLWARGRDPGVPLDALLVALDARAGARQQGSGVQAFVSWVTAVRPELRGRAEATWQRAVALCEGGAPSVASAVSVAAELRSIEQEVSKC
jgi:hypothetical protein